MRKFMRCNDVNSVKFWAYKIKSGVTSLLFHVLQSKNKCEQSKANAFLKVTDLLDRVGYRCQSLVSDRDMEQLIYISILYTRVGF